MKIDIEELYKKYGPMVLRRCRALLKDENKSLDAMQDVFVNLLRSQDRLEALYPSSLLYTMATRVCLNKIRSERRHPEIENDNDMIEQIAVYDETENIAWAKVILDRLLGKNESSTREMLMMHYVDGLTLEEVARESGFSV